MVGFATGFLAGVLTTFVWAAVTVVYYEDWD
jgi:hypothetical protein